MKTYKASLIHRTLGFLGRPVFYGPLAFFGGAYWIQSIIVNYNSSKSHSSLFRGILLDIETRGDLGEAVGSDGTIKGFVNHIKGDADLTFEVEGTKQKGIVRFVGKRYPGSDCWKSELYTLQVGDQTFDWN